MADLSIGEESDALPCLFDLFYRAIGERQSAGPGQSVVKARGGKIGVRSQAGHGTTFTIRPPLARK